MVMGRLLGLAVEDSLRGLPSRPPVDGKRERTGRPGRPVEALVIQLAKDTIAADAPLRINDDWIREA